MRSWPVVACAALTWMLMGLTPRIPLAPTAAGQTAYTDWPDQFPSDLLAAQRIAPESPAHGAGELTATVVPVGGSPSQEVVPTVPDQPPPRFAMSPYAQLVEPAPTFVRVDSPIQVTFSQPMARQTVQRGFRIKPEVPGPFRWIDDETLRFEPARLAYQTQYQIELTGLSASGQPLRGLTSWTFMTQKPITLTIDDCGNEVQLRTILSVLAERHMKAMMFATGSCAARYPWLVNAMVAGGHQVCNHTYSHPHLTRLTDAQVIAEIGAGQLSRACDWVKPPYDDVDDRVDRLIRSLGYRTLYYDVDSLDWQWVSADVMLTRVLSTGGLVSIHFWGENTIEFLRRLPQS
jgi:hypothetical protein